MAQRITVRERIDPAITASLFANYRSSADAVNPGGVRYATLRLEGWIRKSKPDGVAICLEETATRLRIAPDPPN